MKTCKFIECKNKIYIPAPTNWLSGWARQRWLEKFFKDDMLVIVGAERWFELANENKIKILIEKKGKYSVENYAK